MLNAFPNTTGRAFFMSRQPRFVLPGQPQHVIQRGNNRDVIFVADEDYRFYLEKLEAACVRFECDLHAYVLMTNHVHPAPIAGALNKSTNGLRKPRYNCE